MLAVLILFGFVLVWIDCAFHYLCRILCNKRFNYYYLWCNLSLRFHHCLFGLFWVFFVVFVMTIFASARLWCASMTLQLNSARSALVWMKTPAKSAWKGKKSCYSMSCKAVRTLPKVHMESHLQSRICELLPRLCQRSAAPFWYNSVANLEVMKWSHAAAVGHLFMCGELICIT